MASEAEKLISIATIHRHHGIPRDGVLSFKIKFPFSGGEALQHQTFVWISNIKNPPSCDQNEYQRIKLAKDPQPLGGKWGQSSGAILSFDSTLVESFKTPLLGLSVALSRAQFPAIDKSEFYLCDLIGAEIRNENNQVIGRANTYVALSKNMFNLSVETSSGDCFEFPTQWIDWEKSRINPLQPESGTIVVPKIEAWLEL